MACSGNNVGGDATAGSMQGVVAGVDRKPPSAPQPTADTTRTTATLAWAASTDNVGVAGYDVYLDDKLVWTGTDTAFTQDGVLCATSLSYSVDAFDAAGNYSARTPVVATVRPCLSTWGGVLDFFIADVCLDTKGNVLMGVTPFDGNPACVKHRDLMPDENLPYHKVDDSGTKFYDEFPLASLDPSVGTLVMTVKGKLTGNLEIGDGPANVYLRSQKTLSSYSTIDGNGPTYHVASNCAGGVPVVSSLFDTKVRVDIDALSTNHGASATYGLGFEKVYNPSPSCPDADQYTHGVDNEWFFASYTYTLASGQQTPAIQTLVASDIDPAIDDHHLERYYATREIGRTRYEAYQNIAGLSDDKAQIFKDLHDKLVASGACTPLNLAPPPLSPSATWIEIGCRQYNTFAPPDDPVNGDSTQRWTDIAKAANMLAPVLGVQATDNPVVTSMTPSTIDWGYTGPITIAGKHLGNALFGNIADVMFGGGAIHVKQQVSSDGKQVVISFTDKDWQDGSRKGHFLTCQKSGNPMHVFDGISMSTFGSDGAAPTLVVQDCPQ